MDAFDRGGVRSGAGLLLAGVSIRFFFSFFSSKKNVLCSQVLIDVRT
jgi:hypothetical protein